MLSLFIFLFFCHVNLVVIYKDGLRIFYKVLFVKITVFPFKESQKKDALSNVKDAKNTFERLKRYRELSKSIFGFYYRALRLKILNLEVTVSSNDPFSTALCHSMLSQGIACLLKSVEQEIIIQIPKNSNINVRADFLGNEPHFSTHLVMYTYLGPLVIVSVLSFTKMIISFFRRLLNGEFKSKRVN